MGEFSQCFVPDMRLYRICNRIFHLFFVMLCDE